MVIKKKSRIDCIFILNSAISKILSSGQIYTAFIDYEEVYDNINLAYLWQQLSRENISTNMIVALKAMYASIKIIVKYKTETSDVIQSFQGVKQGDASSSLLFMMYVNDIAVNIDGIFTLNELELFLLLYADDQVLLATSAQSLQHMLNDVETYCNK